MHSINDHPQKGILKRWNDSKGFGFVCPEHGGQDIFIHISALKRMSRRPRVGDTIIYQIHTDNDGKKRAVNARIEGVLEVNLHHTQRQVRRNRENNLISKTIYTVMIAGIGFVIYAKYFDDSSPKRIATTSTPNHMIEEHNTENYSCKGKVYCSEMSSCEEAKFYLRHCPGTKMDGDGDGIPCESQWCGS